MKKVVILGGGYAGVAAAQTFQKLNKKSIKFQVELIDKKNHHTLMTQLHEVVGQRINGAYGQVDYQEIFRGKKSIESGITITCDTIIHGDFQNNKLMSEKNTYEYDYLISCTGSRPDFFNVEKAENYAYKVWSHREAVALMEHINNCFYRASTTSLAQDRNQLLTFVVAGGGFTGVEIAGELTYYCKRLCKKYGLPKGSYSIYLVEAGPSILSNLQPKQVMKAMKYLEKLSVKVLLNTMITKVDKEQVYFKEGPPIKSTLIWSAGIKGDPNIAKVDIASDKKDRTCVNQYLQSIDQSNVFCAGDTISLVESTIKTPQIVENARQSAVTAVCNLVALENGKHMSAYKPKFHGSMVSIGPFYGVAKIGVFRVSSIFATFMKHLVNLHYHWVIGGVKLAIRYLDGQFLNRIPKVER